MSDSPHAGPQPDHTSEVIPLTAFEVTRLAELRAMPARSVAQEAEMEVLADRAAGNKGAVPANYDMAPEVKPLLPLTPAEIGRLAELRATPNRTADQNNEMVPLVLREHVPQPVVPPLPLSPEDRDARWMAALEEIHMVLDGIIAAVPSLGGMRYGLARLRGSIAALRAK